MLKKSEMRFPEILLHVNANYYSGEVDVCGVLEQIGEVDFLMGTVPLLRCKQCGKEVPVYDWEDIAAYNVKVTV